MTQYFKSEVSSLKSVFDGDNFYEIPDYQRPYSWTNEQIDILWDDIFEAYTNNHENIFLGPLIVIEKNKKNRQQIVDGQQRLTTFIILFCVLRNYFDKSNKVLHRIKSLENEEARLTTHDDKNIDFQQEIINPNNFDLSKTDNYYLNCAKELKEKIEKAFEKDTLTSFIDYLLDNTVFIKITCTNEDFAITLFETINTRGLDLDPADVLKSRLISNLNDNERQQFIEKWNEIANIAKNADEKMNDLFTYYEYYLLATNPKESLLQELKKQFKGKDPKAIIHDFGKMVKYYYSLFDSNDKDIFALRYLPNQFYWKAILLSAKMKNFKDFDDLKKLLKRTYYLYWIAGYTTTKVKQLTFNIIKSIKTNKNIGEIEKLIDKSFQEHNVIKKAHDEINADAYNNPWIKPLLMLVEYDLTDNSKESFIVLNNKIHVEHILPQAYKHKKEWNTAFPNPEDFELVNNIGNLTLLGFKKNIGAQNKAFKEKREFYAKEQKKDKVTSFILTQKIIDKQQWERKDIFERKKFVLDKLKDIFNINLGDENGN